MSNPNHVIALSLAHYQPSVDIGDLSMRETFLLASLLQSLSNVVAAAIPGFSPAVAHYLDDWQALFSEQVGQIADVVKDAQPADEGSQRARNWLLASFRLTLAEGLMDLTGEGGEDYDDEFSRRLMEQEGSR
ncbi:hypothetical protein JP74_22020 [Devosia sp. 17-2-E-8]|nr:hypothetical protein JP74_22020 [Devosia sp. 17-2-E-8]